MNWMQWKAGRTRKGRLAVGLAVLALLIWGQVHYRMALVIGESMRPGLRTGDLLLVDKQAYRRKDPQRGDIVLAHHDRELIIKRVVGLPGEEVALHLGRLQINGSDVVEDHKIEPGRFEIAPGKLFPGRFALVGDNRTMTAYEGVHAVVTKQQMVGKVVWALRW